MAGFLTPVWLLGFAALAVPILVHLWSRRPRQVVQLGSLRHLAGSPGPRAWGRILDDLPLLLLRLAALAAVVLALAGLGRRTAPGDQGAPQTVVVVDPDALGDSLAFFSDPLVDSLRRSRTPLSFLVEGFPPLDESGIPAPGSRTAGAWSLLAALDASLPEGSHIVVLATARAEALDGARPTLRSGVRWHDPVLGRIRSWVAATWPAGADTVVAVTRESRGFTVLQSLTRSVPGYSAVGSTGQAPVTRPILTNRSAIFYNAEVVAGEEDSNAGQAVAAALASAASVAFGVTPSVAVSSSLSAEIPDPTRTVIAWLSDQSVSDAALSATQRGALLIEFPRLLQPLPDNSQLVPVGSSAAAPALEAATITGRVDSLVGVPVFTDRAGNPLASITRRGEGLHVRLATRPGVGWSDLSESGALAEVAYHLLTLGIHPADPAPVSASQAAPGQSAGRASGVAAIRPWGRMLLLAAAVLLLAERWLAHRPRVATA